MGKLGYAIRSGKEYIVAIGLGSLENIIRTIGQIYQVGKIGEVAGQTIRGIVAVYGYLLSA
jgi:hypothetical protein